MYSPRGLAFFVIGNAIHSGAVNMGVAELPPFLVFVSFSLRVKFYFFFSVRGGNLIFLACFNKI